MKKIKLFSFLLSLILVMVSVPMAVVAEKVDTSEVSEIVTEIQDNLTVTEQENDIVMQESVDQMVTTSESDSQLVTGIPDGIYAIEIATLSSYYIYYDTSATCVLCSSIAISPMAIGMNTYLFSITHVPNTERYIIRSVVDPTKTFYSIANSVDWKSIPTNDNEVPIANTFNIIYDNGAYLLKEVGSGKYLCGGSGNALFATNSPETQVLKSWRFRGYRSYIEDGVYSFENLVNVGLWMDTQHDSYLPGKYAQQYAYESCPINDMSRGGMFKINRIGDTDQYTIRLMTNNLLAWGVDGTNVISQSLGIDETQIPDNAKFHIAYDNGTYIIIPYGTMNAITATPNSSASGNSGGTDAYLSTVSQFSLTNSAKWKMYKYVGGARYGASIIIPNEVTNVGAIVGNSYEINVVYWHTTSKISSCFLALSDECSNIATLIWDDNNSAILNVNNPGQIICNVGLLVMQNNSYQINILNDMIYYAVPKQGTYLIKNLETDKHINIEGPSTEVGATIHQWGFHTGQQAQWEIEHTDISGYVRIRSVYSDLYISVDPNNLNEIKQYNYSENYSLWKVQLTESNNIIFKNRLDESKVIAIPLSDMGNGADLTIREYTNNSDFTDEWKLNYIGSLHSVTLIGQPETNVCWATSAKMFASNYDHQVSYIDIDEVIREVKQLDNTANWNIGGNLSDVASAINYNISKSNNIASLDLTYNDFCALSEENICNILDNGDVMVISYIYYEKVGTNYIFQFGHAVLLVGYYIEDGVRQFVVNDPSPKNIGAYRIYTYQELLSRHNGYSEKGNPYYWMWSGFLTVVSEYSSDVIPGIYW